MLAEAAVPTSVPPDAVMVLVVFVNVPTAVPATCTESVQDAFAASVRLLSVIVLAPSGAVTVAPEQVVVRPLGTAMASPPGKVSKNTMPLKDVVLLGLLMVNVSVVEAPNNSSVASAKALVRAPPPPPNPPVLVQL